MPGTRIDRKLCHAGSASVRKSHVAVARLRREHFHRRLRNGLFFLELSEQAASGFPKDRSVVPARPPRTGRLAAGGAKHCAVGAQHESYGSGGRSGDGRGAGPGPGAWLRQGPGPCVRAFAPPGGSRGAAEEKRANDAGCELTAVIAPAGPAGWPVARTPRPTPILRFVSSPGKLSAGFPSNGSALTITPTPAAATSRSLRTGEILEARQDDAGFRETPRLSAPGFYGA